MSRFTRRKFINVTTRGMAGVGLLQPLASFAGKAPARTSRPNILFFSVDDLKPALGCYGDPVAKTPNIDRVARKGLVFARAYCQQAVCSPSRTSLMTGLRPDTTRIYDLETHFRKTIPDVTTLPELLKQQGYHTQAMSKIYHGGLDDAQSWSVPHWSPRRPTYASPEGLDLTKRLAAEAKAAGKDPKDSRSQVRGLPWEAADVADDAYGDGATADRAIEVLRQIKDHPFFLAVGFLKPHLPFVAPKRYWDMYDKKQFKLPTNDSPPTDAPELAMSGWGELRAYHGMPKTGSLTKDQALSMYHGYYAATSYMDAQVGKVLDELERLGLADNTIVVVWGDNGWHLGDHGLWCKHTNFEQAVRVPLIISIPGQQSAGKTTDALVEFVDIYPTLCELAGAPLADGLEGTSFRPLIEDPGRRWKKAAFSQYPRSWRGQRFMGYTMRTDRYRFTQWLSRDGDARFTELYDLQSDPEERVNISGRRENATLVKQLEEMLRAGWRKALPA